MKTENSSLTKEMKLRAIELAQIKGIEISHSFDGKHSATYTTPKDKDTSVKVTNHNSDDALEFDSSEQIGEFIQSVRKYKEMILKYHQATTESKEYTIQQLREKTSKMEPHDWSEHGLTVIGDGYLESGIRIHVVQENLNVSPVVIGNAIIIS